MANRNHPIPSRRSGRREGVVAALVSGFLLVFLTTQWMGCSSPEQKYRVLSFFFDGVPDPNAPRMALNDEQGGSAVLRTGSVHQPFAENKCDACHASATGRFEDFDKVDESSCMKCHEHARDQYVFMHGPVATGACRLCHSPHESSVKFLLNDASPTLCLNCHDREFLPAEPADHQTNRDCLECHVGHGSSKRMLLRADWNGPAPATAVSAADSTSPGGK